MKRKIKEIEVLSDDILDDIVKDTPGAKQYDAHGKLISENTDDDLDDKKDDDDPDDKKDDDYPDDKKDDNDDDPDDKKDDDDDPDDKKDDDDLDDKKDDDNPDDKDEETKRAASELAAINAFLESDYENLDTAKTAYRNEIKADKEKINSLTGRVTELTEQIDPLKYFGGDKDAFVLQQLKNLKPDLDPSALTTVMTADLKEMDAVDIIALKMKLENPGAVDGPGQATAKEMAYSELGIDPEYKDDLTPMQKSKMEIEANKARKEFAKLSEEVEVPTVDGLTAKRQELIDTSAKEWTPVVKEELVKNLDSVTFSAKGQDGKMEKVFEFAISDDYKKAILDSADQTITDLASKGVEITDQTKRAIVKAWKDEFVRQNLAKIMQAHTNDHVANMSEAEFNKRHNPKDDGKKRQVRRKAQPVDNDAKMKDAAEKAILAGNI